MKKYIIFTFFFLTSPAGFTQFQPGYESTVPYSECNLDSNCFNARLQEDDLKQERQEQQELEKLETREEQEEAESKFTDFNLKNEDFETIKENAEQPELNK